MMNRYVILTSLSALLIIASGWLVFPREVSAERLAPAVYDFGDLMEDFVNDSAAYLANKHIQDEYAARSLNGMQITLDKIREHANGASSVSASTNALIAQQATAMRHLQNIEAGTAAPPSGEVIAEFAGIASQARDACYHLAYRREMMQSMKIQLNEMLRPMTMQEFKKESLDLVPLNYIMTSIGGSKPEFNLTIGASVSMYYDGQTVGVESEQTAGFFLIGAYAAYKDEEEYNAQSKKYYKALNLLPRLMPADTTCLRVYLEGYEVARKLYQEEISLLGLHLDSLEHSLKERYKVMQSMRRSIENGLLSARVRAASQYLSIASFNIQDQEKIRTAAYSLRNQRSQIAIHRDTAMFGKNRANIYFALEEIKEISSAAIATTDEMDSVALYEPLHPFLADNKKWLTTWGNWAEVQLAAGQVQQAAVLDTSELLLQTIATSTKTKRFKKTATPEYHLLSVALDWPGNIQGTPYHSSFTYMGRDVWTRGTDGAFIRDYRQSSEGMIGRAKSNLRKRAEKTTTQYRAALTLANTARPVRQSEISRQSNDISRDYRRTQTVASSIPANYSAVPLPVNKPPLQGLKPAVPVSTTYTVQREKERNRLFLLSLPEATRNSPAIQQYSETHRMYLDYAEALDRDGYLQQADNMADAAITMRATLRGFDMSGVRLPVFDVPDIPFNPFTKQDWQYIYGRHLDYEVMSNNLGNRSQWFKAASMVTDLNELGLSDMPPTSFSTAAKFLRDGNQYLYPLNMQNGTAILQGTLTGSFVTPDNELIVFDELHGKELDYALVAFEQSKVQVFIHEFRTNNPDISMDAVFLQINAGMRLNPISTSILRRAMFNSFQFQNYSDRVRLGRRIIDELYRLRQEP